MQAAQVAVINASHDEWVWFAFIP